jgi:DNA invertase Pin-like site-specific DNA recombinase
LFNGKETRNTASSGKYTRTRLSSTNISTQYGNSLGYTQFHIVETKETAFADLSQKVETNEMFKYINEHPEYNTILTTEISRIGRRQSILHSIKEHCLAKQTKFISKIWKLLDDNGK